MRKVFLFYGAIKSFRGRDRALGYIEILVLWYGVFWGVQVQVVMSLQHIARL